MTWKFWTVIACMCCAGCATQTAKIRQLQPAEANNLPRTLGVLDVLGRQEQVAVAQAAVVDQLRESGFYAVVEEAELQRATAASLRHQDSNLNMPAALAAARQLGVDALLLTTLEIREASGTPYGTVTFRVGDPNIAAKLSFQLIDARTGNVLDQNMVSSDYHKGKLDPLSSSNNSEARILTGLTRQAASRLAHQLAPHTSQVEVRLAGKALGRGGEQIRQGNKAAQSGHWDKAAEHWTAALEDDPRNHAAWYNMGLAFEAMHQYQRAGRTYERAIKVHDRSLYREGLERCQLAANQYHQAIAQRAESRSRAPLSEIQLAQRPMYQPPAAAAPPRERAAESHSASTRPSFAAQTALPASSPSSSEQRFPGSWPMLPISHTPAARSGQDGSTAPAETALADTGADQPTQTDLRAQLDQAPAGHSVDKETLPPAITETATPEVLGWPSETLASTGQPEAASVDPPQPRLEDADPPSAAHGERRAFEAQPPPTTEPLGASRASPFRPATR